MRLFTEKEYKTYKNLCHLTERNVMQMMANFLKSKYQTIYVTPAYIYAVGDIPVTLVAHTDTVFLTPPSIDNFFYDKEKNVVWNPDGMGADDRAGVFAIIYILRTTSLRPSIILTTKEEIGCIGASKMITQHKELAPTKFMIQLDRRHISDSVYYDCDNPEFEKFINGFGFTTAIGILSDISILAPHYKCAAVNLSIGYKNEHTSSEILYVDGMFNTITKVINILTEVQNNQDIPFFEYIEAVNYYGWPYYNFYDDDEDNFLQYSKGTKVQCDVCKKYVDYDKTLPIKIEGRPRNMCLDCYATYYNRVAWCNCCYQGFLLDEPHSDEELKNYTCQECAPWLTKVKKNNIIYP